MRIVAEQDKICGGPRRAAPGSRTNYSNWMMMATIALPKNSFRRHGRFVRLGGAWRACPKKRALNIVAAAANQVTGKWRVPHERKLLN